jgi:hypothetical protein
MPPRAACTGAIIAAVASCLAPTPAWASGLYLALGDSVSASHQGGPVERYYRFLSTPGHGGLDQLSNLATGGETSTSMRSPGGQLDKAIAVVDNPSDTRVVTLDIGGNDALTGQCPPHSWNTNSCPFRESYRAIVQRLATALANDPGDETFQVMEYYNPASGTGSSIESGYDRGLLGEDMRIDCSASGSSLGLNDLIACLGRDAGAAAVDPYPTFKAGGQRLLAGNHPSPLGDRYLACLFERPERAGRPPPCLPSVTLSAPRREHMRSRSRPFVFVRVGWAANVRAYATMAIPRLAHVLRLRSRTIAVTADQRTKLGLQLSKRSRRLVRRALNVRGKLTATVKVHARIAGESLVTVTRKIRLVR